jgi:hypothetical protein
MVYGVGLYGYIVGFDMAENMMSPAHKATNEKSREGYDNIKWDREGKVDRDNQENNRPD